MTLLQRRIAFYILYGWTSQYANLLGACQPGEYYFYTASAFFPILGTTMVPPFWSMHSFFTIIII